mgnify:FL=1
MNQRKPLRPPCFNFFQADANLQRADLLVIVARKLLNEAAFYPGSTPEWERERQDWLKRAEEYLPQEGNR